MARAKRTARADARRRYRAAQAPADIEGDEPLPGPLATTSARTSAAVPASGGALGGLFSGIRLPSVREDLVAMPQVIRTSPPIWAAFGLGVLAIVAGLVINPNDTGIMGFLLPLFIQAPGIPVLVGGFVAPRGAWFIGLLLGLMQAVGLLAAIYRTTPDNISGGSALVALLSGAILGALFGGLAGWYRRWLRNMSTRNAAMRAEREKQQRRDAKRSTRPAR
ncbi:MAG: hypothetical protein ACHQZR_00500 [Candidatus Limnocylindrales bacterium]